MPTPPQRDSAPPTRVVIPVLAGLGNSILAIPLVRQVKRAFPSCRITILARNDAMGEPYRRLGEIEEVLVTGLGFRESIRAVKETRRRKPDLFLVPFPSNRWQYSLLAALSGAKKKILHGYPVGFWRAMHFVGQRIPAQRGIHDVQQNLRLLEMLGIEPDSSEAPKFQATAADRVRADEMLKNAGISQGSKFIAVHAGSASDTVLARAKRWPPENYGRLIDQMTREFDLPVVVLEGPDESGVAEEILKHSSGAKIHVIKLTGPLGDAAAILERSTLYVGSDSGLAHLAAAVGKRAVTIFAPADPDRVCPYGSRDLVVQAKKTCSPCFTYPYQTPYSKVRCREPFCITEVTVERVMEAVRRGITGTAFVYPTANSKPGPHPSPLPEYRARERGGMLRAAAWIACAVVLGFVGVALVKQFRQVPWSTVHFRAGDVLMASACLLGVAGVQLLARWGLLRAYDQDLPWRLLLPAAWVPAMGKYVVSGFVSVGGAVVMLRSYGIPAAIALSVTVLIDALAVLAGFIVSTPLLLWGPLHQRLPTAWAGCVLVSALGVILLHPRIFVSAVNLALKRFGRQTIDQTPATARYLLPVLASFGQWLFAGLSLWFMTAAVMDVSIKLIPLFIASSALATTIGYLTPFAPGGIGVREGLYLLTLGPTIGPNVAIVALAMRIVQTLMEVGLALVGLWMLKTRPASQPMARVR